MPHLTLPQPARLIYQKYTGNSCGLITNIPHKYMAWQIAGKQVLIVGGGEVAAQRIVSILEANGCILVVAPKINEKVRSLIDDDKVQWQERTFADSDISGGYDMILTALDDHEESLRIGALCRQARIPVNVADVPHMCDFYFMSQHHDGPVQIAVSTNGYGPKLANMIRRSIAAALPPNIGPAVQKMGELRAKVREWAPALDQSSKRMNWVTSVCESWGLENITRLVGLSGSEEQAMYDRLEDHFEQNTIPTIHEALPALSAIQQQQAELALVGAGPGDPELITIKAKRYLQNAGLVVSDRLVPQPVLDLVEGELRVARKVTGKSDEAQEELMQWCLEGLKKGQKVVRLKIGDPLLFGRGGEEIQWFREHGYEPELIPGISSALSAPMAARVPVTHRGVSDQVIITTGRGTRGTLPDLPAYSPSRTLVELMAVGRASELKKKLLECKYPGDCPVCWIEKANCPDERVLFGVVDTMDIIVEEHSVVAPAVLVVGATARLLNTKSY